MKYVIEFESTGSKGILIGELGMDGVVYVPVEDAYSLFFREFGLQQRRIITAEGEVRHDSWIVRIGNIEWNYWINSRSQLLSWARSQMCVEVGVTPSVHVYVEQYNDLAVKVKLSSSGFTLPETIVVQKQGRNWYEICKNAIKTAYAQYAAGQPRTMNAYTLGSSVTVGLDSGLQSLEALFGRLDTQPSWYPDWASIDWDAPEAMSRVYPNQHLAESSRTASEALEAREAARRAARQDQQRSGTGLTDLFPGIRPRALAVNPVRWVSGGGVRLRVRDMVTTEERSNIRAEVSRTVRYVSAGPNMQQLPRVGSNDPEVQRVTEAIREHLGIPRRYRRIIN